MNSAIRDTLKYVGVLGHLFAVIEPNPKHGRADDYDGPWRLAAECGTLHAARKFAAERPGSMIYGKTKPLPEGGKTWERYPKRRDRD